MTGNVLVGYARLNVPDGLWTLCNSPWSKEHFEEPCLVSVPDDVEVLRAVYDRDQQALILRLRPTNFAGGAVRMEIGNAREYPQVVYRDGSAIDSETAGLRLDDEILAIDMNIEKATDVTLIWARS